MSESLDSKINKIVMKYVGTASVLYSTQIFFSSAIINAFEEGDADLIRDYTQLENDLRGLHKDFEGDFYNEIVRRHMSCMCFISLVSAFEEFLVDLCILALKEHPQKISGEKVDFKKALEMSREELIEFKAKEYLNKIMYLSPKDYLKSLCELLSLNQKALSDDFIKYIEIKARRDLGVHNDWRKNDIYERKVNECGASTPEDAKFLRPSVEYFRYTNAVCRSLMGKITKQSCDKLFKVPFTDFLQTKIPKLG